jgi:hypothetical protein
LLPDICARKSGTVIESIRVREGRLHWRRRLGGHGRWRRRKTARRRNRLLAGFQNQGLTLALDVLLLGSVPRTAAGFRGFGGWACCIPPVATPVSHSITLRCDFRRRLAASRILCSVARARWVAADLDEVTDQSLRLRAASGRREPRLSFSAWEGCHPRSVVRGQFVAAGEHTPRNVSGRNIFDTQ